MISVHEVLLEKFLSGIHDTLGQVILCCKEAACPLLGV